MPRLFTNEEYADIHFLYGFANGNAEAARREYGRRYPNRRQPDADVFIKIHNRFRQFGLKNNIGNNDNRRNRRNANEILAAFDHNPRLSSRRASRQLRISKTNILRVLHEDNRKPFHLQPVQDLIPGDAQRRLNFCQWLLNSLEGNPEFVRKILWTDEATFTRRGVVNFHNLHVWSRENPHEIRPRSFQNEFSVNVWLGVIDNNLCGPHFLPNRLNAQLFFEFLNNHLFEVLEDVPLLTRNGSWIQMDGAPAHFGQIIREWLNENYPGRWIGRLGNNNIPHVAGQGPVPWPARSPDLTPLDFHVWGHIKDKVYSTAVDTRAQLVLRIEEACRELKENDHILSATINSIRKRCEKCIQVGGMHFEQLL